MKKFLTARWQDLVMANYEVAPEILARLLPKGTTLDFQRREMRLLSLVAFMFLETRVLKNFGAVSTLIFEESQFAVLCAARNAGRNEARRGFRQGNRARDWRLLQWREFFTASLTKLGE